MNHKALKSNLKAVIVGTIVGATVTIVGAANASQSDLAPTRYLPCQYEDSNNCVWDARHMGNGVGQSYYVSRTGKVTLLPHHIAHFLLTH
jgi:hypothetical protein